MQAARNLASALMLGAFVFVAWQYLHTRSELERESRKVSALADAITEIGDRPQEVVRIIERPTGAHPSVHGADAGIEPAVADLSADATSERSPEPAEPRDPNDQHEVAALFTERFAAEPVDDRWAYGKVREIEAIARAFSSLRQPPKISCHSTLCRIEASFTSVEEHNHFVDEVAAKTSDGAGVTSPQVEQHDDGSISAVAYWARAGHMVANAP